MTAEPTAFSLDLGDHVLSGDRRGAGPPIVLLHGLTATRRYVVQGSSLLARRGYELIGYDARGHGDSSPAPDARAYEYADLAGDLAAVLDRLEIERPVLAGHSMGAATALALALEHPERVTALVQVTPAFAGVAHADPADLARWGSLADGLERAGIDGFLAAYADWLAADDQSEEGQRWQGKILAFTRQRLERHRHLDAVTDALRVVPGSEAFTSLDSLRSLDLPVLVVGSRDESDPGHPLTVAQAYADHLPRAELIVEDPGQPPLAWRGAQLSRAIADFLGVIALDHEYPHLVE